MASSSLLLNLVSRPTEILLKAHNCHSYDGKLRMFRPDQNCKRMVNSAVRVSLPTFDPVELEKLIAELIKVDGPSKYLHFSFELNQNIETSESNLPLNFILQPHLDILTNIRVATKRQAWKLHIHQTHPNRKRPPTRRPSIHFIIPTTRAHKLTSKPGSPRSSPLRASRPLAGLHPLEKPHHTCRRRS